VILGFSITFCEISQVTGVWSSSKSPATLSKGQCFSARRIHDRAISRPCLTAFVSWNAYIPGLSGAYTLCLWTRHAEAGSHLRVGGLAVAAATAATQKQPKHSYSVCKLFRCFAGTASTPQREWQSLLYTPRRAVRGPHSTCNTDALACIKTLDDYIEPYRTSFLTSILSQAPYSDFCPNCGLSKLWASLVLSGMCAACCSTPSLR
jgi:hypothetical protein